MSHEGQVWFSTSDLKLAVALHAAGFGFKKDAECTRIMDGGRESFTWHFDGTNADGESINAFLLAWEKPNEGTPRPSNLACFLLAREVMFNRTHIIAESHRVPQHLLLQRGDKRLLVTSRLGKEEKAKLSAML